MIVTLPRLSITLTWDMFTRDKSVGENSVPNVNRPLLVALLKAVMDTSNVPLAIVRPALTVMLIGGGSTRLKSVPVN